MKTKSFSKEKMWEVLYSDSFASIISALMTIILGMLAGLIILLVISPETAWGAFTNLLTGGLAVNGFRRGMGSILYYAVPIILTGLSIGFAYKTGEFNIGASGQYTMGAVTAIFVAVLGENVFGNCTWLVAIILGAVAGGVWALVAALLKVHRNINVVISGIMLNYVGIFVVNWIIKKSSVYEKSRNWTAEIPDVAVIPRLGLDHIFGNKPVNLGIIIAVAIAIVTYFVLKKTTFGYEMKACGLNQSAAKYAGINEKKTILKSLVIAGMFAGLGGALYYLAAQGTHHMVTDTIKQEGYTGISVALLGMLNPIGIIFTGLFIAYLQVGGLHMQSYGLEPEIVDVITAIIIFFCAFSFKLKQFYFKILNKIHGGAR